MKHASSRDVFNYWNERRGVRPAPDRNEIEPSAIRRALGDTFILTFDADAGHPFRLAGTRVCALFCGELKGRPFLPLWENTQRGALRELIGIVDEELVGVVAGVTGSPATGTALAPAAPIDLELLLLPLHHRIGRRVRLLGVLAPIAPPYWLGAHPLTGLRLGSLRHLDPGLETTAAPGLRSGRAADDLRARLVVHEGGRTQ